MNFESFDAPVSLLRGDRIPKTQIPDPPTAIHAQRVPLRQFLVRFSIYLKSSYLGGQGNQGILDRAGQSKGESQGKEFVTEILWWVRCGILEDARCGFKPIYKKNPQRATRDNDIIPGRQNGPVCFLPGILPFFRHQWVVRGRS